MDTCKTCAFWSKARASYGLCNRITDEDFDPENWDGSQSLAVTSGRIIDHGYDAEGDLYTRAEFGCVLHMKKDD
jgi:hypothetical protein